MKNEEKIKEIVDREFKTGIDLKDDKDVKKLLLELATWKDEQLREILTHIHEDCPRSKARHYLLLLNKNAL